MRKSRPGITLLLACLVVLALAPAAAAQLPVDPVGTIGDPLGGDPLGGGTGGSGSGSDGSDGGGSGGGVGGVVDSIGDTLDGDSGTSKPEGETDGDPTLLEDTLNKVGGTVNEPEKTINETTQDPSGSVGGTIGGIGHMAEDGVNDISKALDGKDGKRTKAPKTTGGVTTGTGRFGSETYNDMVFAKSLAAREADAKNRTPSTLTSSFEATKDAGSGGVIAQIGRVAAEAAEQAAFPLLLTLLVVGFLVGQNRIDSRDPKLALAPIDSDQDLLSFT